MLPSEAFVPFSEAQVLLSEAQVPPSEAQVLVLVLLSQKGQKCNIRGHTCLNHICHVLTPLYLQRHDPVYTMCLF